MTRVFDIFITALKFQLDGHTECGIEPTDLRLSEVFSPVPTAMQLPRDTAEEKHVALYRNGVEVLAATTNFPVSVADAAEQAGIELAEAHRLVDGDNRQAFYAFLASVPAR